MGSGTKGQSQQQTQQTPTALPQYNELMSRLMQQSQQPYTPYGGELVAPTNQNQTNAWAQLAGAYGSAQPFINQAAQYATLGASPIQASAIQNYSNPYQDMVTKATMNQLQNVQQANNAASMGQGMGAGGLFNDRLGVQQGQLANQESLANAQTLGGLNSANYSQALQAAQGDRSAAAQAAYTFGNLGNENLQTLLQGAQGTLTAGQLQQQQQQAIDTANYGQWQQAQAFPYQQLSWATGLGTGLGSQMGGNSQTTNTPAQPNPWNQALGLGMFGLGMYSDRRLKEDVHEVGKTKDGQPIYRFRYKGDPRFQMGLMAQEVEKDHPEAVGEKLGFKTVDLKKATDEAAGFAAGGTPYGDAGMGFGDVGATPFASASGYIPKSGGPAAQPWSMKTPSMPEQKQSDGMKPLKDMMDAGKKAGPDAKGFFNDLFGQKAGDPISLDPSSPGPAAVGPDAPAPLLDLGGGGLYRAGGTVRGFADGGGPDYGDLEGGTELGFDDFTPDGPRAPHGFLPATRFGPEDDDQRLGPGSYALGDIGPGTGFNFNPTRGDANRIYAEPENVLPRPRPEPGQDLEHDEAPELPPAREVPGGPRSFADASEEPTGSLGSGRSLGDVRASDVKEERSSALKNALMTAGMGLMASRSPWLGSAIGEAGMAGLSAYSGTQKQERQEKLDAKKMELQMEKINAAERRADRTLGLHTEQLAETKRYHEQQLQSGKVPPGYRATKDGLEPIPGGPHDPAVVRATEEAKTAAKNGPGMSPEAKEVMARSMISGNYQGYNSLGRTKEGLRVRDDLNNMATEIVMRERGTNAQQASQYLNDQKQEFAARQIGINTEARTTGQREANLNLILKVADAAVPAALELNDQATRLGGPIVPLNRIIQKGEVMTSDPIQARFGVANLQLAESWARAMNPTGVMRDADRDLALKHLDTGLSTGTYKAVVQQIQEQIKLERDSIRGADPRTPLNLGQQMPVPGAAPAGGAAAAPSQAAPQASPAPPRPPGIPPGSQYSPSRQQWRSPDGHIYDAKGAAVQ